MQTHPDNTPGIQTHTVRLTNFAIFVRALFAILWPALYFGAVVFLSVALIRAGAFWPLPAFVLPLTVLLLRGRPTPPGGL